MNTPEVKPTSGPLGGLGVGASARVLRRVFLAPAALYRHDRGWLLGRHFLALTHTGRRTGAIHTTVVEVVHRDPVRDEYIVMAAFGRQSDWYRNIQRHPPTRIAVGRRSFQPVWRELGDQDSAALLADYESRRWWWGPLLPWLTGKLLGEPYVSTPERRLAVVRERPMVAFSPVHTPGPREKGAGT